MLASVHIVRGFQDALNRAWSSAVTPGSKLATDEMMAKDKSRAGSSLQRFNNTKPIKQGECITRCGIRLLRNGCVW